MLYKDFKGLQLSELGMGNMRLPTIGGDDNQVDTEKAVAVIRGAYERGVNYFDTAWGYHGGNSETWLTNSPATTCRTSASRRRYLPSSSSAAAWSTSTSTCSTTCAS